MRTVIIIAVAIIAIGAWGYFREPSGEVIGRAHVSQEQRAMDRESGLVGLAKR